MEHLVFLKYKMKMICSEFIAIVLNSHYSEFLIIICPNGCMPNINFTKAKSVVSVQVEELGYKFNKIFQIHHCASLHQKTRDHKKTGGFLMFSRGTERDQWHEIG